MIVSKRGQLPSVLRTVRVAVLFLFSMEISKEGGIYIKSGMAKFIRALINTIIFVVIDEGINILYEIITGQICEMGVLQLIIGLVSLLLTFLCDKVITCVLRKEK